MESTCLDRTCILIQSIEVQTQNGVFQLDPNKFSRSLLTELALMFITTEWYVDQNRFSSYLPAELGA